MKIFDKETETLHWGDVRFSKLPSRREALELMHEHDLTARQIETGFSISLPLMETDFGQLDGWLVVKGDQSMIHGFVTPYAMKDENSYGPFTTRDAKLADACIGALLKHDLGAPERVHERSFRTFYSPLKRSRLYTFSWCNIASLYSTLPRFNTAHLMITPKT